MDVNFCDLASKIGFENDQRLHSALRAKDVKSGLIEKIAGAIGCKVGELFGEANTFVCQEDIKKMSDLEDQNKKLWAIIDKLTKE